MFPDPAAIQLQQRVCADLESGHIVCVFGYETVRVQMIGGLGETSTRVLRTNIVGPEQVLDDDIVLGMARTADAMGVELVAE